MNKQEKKKKLYFYKKRDLLASLKTVSKDNQRGG